MVLGITSVLHPMHPLWAGQHDAAADVIKIQSAILHEERILRISLPDDYVQTQRSYPLLIQLDGTAEALAIAVNDVRTLSSRGEIPVMIVAGIENTDRWRDMLPVKLKKRPSAGGADNFLAFLQDELLPYLDRNYRLDSTRILYGRSNSALFAVFALTGNSAAFTGYIAASPSLGHCKDVLFRRTVSYLSRDPVPTRFMFVTHGGLDTALRLVSPIPEFVALLSEKSPANLAWDYRYYENEGHCPTPTLRDGLVWLFQQARTDAIQAYDQPPPGRIPTRFALGSISTGTYSETGCTFTPDGKELYFTRSGGDLDAPTIFVSSYRNHSWTQPVQAPLPGYGPHIAPDGQTIFVCHIYDFSPPFLHYCNDGAYEFIRNFAFEAY